MELIEQLRAAGKGTEEWRVADPADGSYCIAFSRDDSINPEREAREWLADHRKRFQDSQHAHYKVQRVMAKYQADRLMCQAADELDRLRAMLGECAPMVYANAEALHMLDGFRPQEREFDDLARRLRAELTPNA